METLIRPRGFIAVEVIASSPGNPKRPILLRSKTIDGVGLAPNEYIQLGAESYISFVSGNLSYSTESMEAIAVKIAEAEKEND